MVNYAFYQIELSKPDSSNTMAEMDVPLDKAQEYFGHLFKKSCTFKLISYDSKGNKKDLTNTVLEHKDDIIVWRIHNEQAKELWKPNGKFVNGIEEYEAQTELSEPHSNVIINNKSGMLYLAVEKSTTWRSSTNKVRDIVKRNLKPLLFDKFNLELEIRELTIPSKIWDYADTICQNGNDYITGIEIKIINPNSIAPRHRINRESTPELLQQMQDFAILTGAVSTVIGANYKDALPSQLKDSVENIVRVVRLCTQREFALTLNFKNHGAYQCDENVIAIFPMKDDVVSSFLLHNSELFDSCPLQTWFEKSIEELEKLRNENATPKPKNHKNS